MEKRERGIKNDEKQRIRWRISGTYNDNVEDDNENNMDVHYLFILFFLVHSHGLSCAHSTIELTMQQRFRSGS